MLQEKDLTRKRRNIRPQEQLVRGEVHTVGRIAVVRICGCRLRVVSQLDLRRPPKWADG